MTRSALSLPRVWLDFLLITLPTHPCLCLITLFPDAESLGASVPCPGKSSQVLAWAGSGKNLLLSHPFQG